MRQAGKHRKAQQAQCLLAIGLQGFERFFCERSRTRYGRQRQHGVVPDDLFKFLRELRPAQALAGNEICGDFRAEGKTVRDAGAELAITRRNPATMRRPGFRTLNVTEDQIEFIY